MKTASIAAALLAAVLMSGCATRTFTLFPTGHIMITNECPSTISTIYALDRVVGTVEAGASPAFVSLTSLGPSYRNLIAQVKDSVTNVSFGSVSQGFSLSTTPYGPDEYVWHIECPPQRYRSFFERLMDLWG